MDKPRRSPRSLSIIAGRFWVISLLLPATCEGGGSALGIYVAFLSLFHPVSVLSNVGLLAAGILLSFGKYRSALVASVLSVVSMVACGVLAPAEPANGGFFLATPGGNLGPGYYVWLLAGLLMLFATMRAFPAIPSAVSNAPGRFREQADRINAEIAAAQMSRASRQADEDIVLRS